MTERDTKFLGFAKLLQQELIDMYEHDMLDTIPPIFRETYEISYEDTQWRKRNLTLIAQRAYDLACHVLDEAPITEYEWDIHNATDLTEWPKTAE